jgi:hypothetical protein
MVRPQELARTGPGSVTIVLQPGLDASILPARTLMERSYDERRPRRWPGSAIALQLGTRQRRYSEDEPSQHGSRDGKHAGSLALRRSVLYEDPIGARPSERTVHYRKRGRSQPRRRAPSISRTFRV